ncbi:MAG TPA: PaaI family thioesterase [Rhizobiales bacterium]|nr:PaaI family thioesterase [Hyphomicrobiales bacterium]
MSDTSIPAAQGAPGDRDWTPIRPSRFTGLIGEILASRKNGVNIYGIRVEDRHDNSTGRAHGGLIMAFCDEVMGLEAHDPSTKDIFFTVNFECQFVSGAMIGDFLEVTVERIEAGRSMVVMRGTCRSAGRVVATCTGVWKRSAKKYAEKDW